MAHWTIEDLGFGGTVYYCSECKDVFNDIYHRIYIDGPCPSCGAVMNEDEAVYLDDTRERGAEKMDKNIPLSRQQGMELNKDVKEDKVKKEWNIEISLRNGEKIKGIYRGCELNALDYFKTLFDTGKSFVHINGNAGEDCGGLIRISEIVYIKCLPKEADESQKSIRKFNSRDVIFDDYRQAKTVLKNMRDILHKYGLVTVADFMDLSGICPQGYSNTKYGWCSFNNSVAVCTKDDKYYYINLPDPLPLFRE